MSFMRTKAVADFAGGALLLAGLGACSAERTEEEPEVAAEDADGEAAAGGLVGIAMPTKSLERWNKDGSHLLELLEEAGFETNLQYADNKIDQQITQLQNMINAEVDIL